MLSSVSKNESEKEVAEKYRQNHSQRCFIYLYIDVFIVYSICEAQMRSHVHFAAAA